MSRYQTREDFLSRQRRQGASNAKPLANATSSARAAARSRVDEEDQQFHRLVLTMIAAAGVVFLALLAFQSTSSAEVAGQTIEELDGTVVERPSEASGWVLYRRGLYEEAIAEWQLAVETKADSGAAFKIAEEYFDAKVVKRDMAKVVKYLTIGADGGDARAQMDLATLYDNGWGVEKDVEKAGALFLASAEQGMLEAQYNVATMFETGQGFEVDLEKSYMFFLLAVEGGFQPFAQTGLDGVMKKMTPQQIKAGTIMARKFETTKKADKAVAAE